MTCWKRPDSHSALYRGLALVTETAPGISAFDADAVQRLLPSLEAGGVEGDPLLFELASLAVLQRAFDCR